MFSFHELIIFTAAAFILAITPGVDFLLTSSRTLSQGVRAGFLTMLGILTGLIIVALMTALGLAAIIAKVPIVYEIIRWAGVAYLLFLSFETLRTKPASVPETLKLKPISGWRIYFDGVMNNVLNPKCALFALAVYPQFWHSQGSVVGQTLILASIYCFIGFIVLSLVVLLTSRFHKIIKGNAKFRNFSRYLLASVFAALALKVAFSNKS